jgi:Fe2+ or Zn2+ uptake regulation protein
MVDHATHLKAVNHPIRREILRFVNESEKISRAILIDKLKKDDIINEDSVFQYNMDFLLQAECVKKIEENNEISYEILPAGKVIEKF